MSSVSVQDMIIFFLFVDLVLFIILLIHIGLANPTKYNVHLDKNMNL